MVTPSSFAWASSSSGAAHAWSASRPAGRSLSIAKSPIASRIICCSSVGVRSKSSARTPFAWRAGWSSFLLRGERAPGGAGGTEAVLGGRVEEALGALAHADAVEQLEPGDAVEGPEAEAHASVGGVHRRFQGKDGRMRWQFLPLRSNPYADDIAVNRVRTPMGRGE